MVFRDHARVGLLWLVVTCPPLRSVPLRARLPSSPIRIILLIGAAPVCRAGRRLSVLAVLRPRSPAASARRVLRSRSS